MTENKHRQPYLFGVQSTYDCRVCKKRYQSLLGRKKTAIGWVCPACVNKK